MNPSDGQVTVALAIVAGLVVIALGAIVTAIVVPSVSGPAWVFAGTCGGALATALNAPSGIAAAISEIKKPPASVDPTPPSSPA